MNCKIQNTRKSILDFLFYRLTRTLREYATTIQGFSLCVEISGYFFLGRKSMYFMSSFHVRAWFAGIKADGVGEGGCDERTIRSAKFFGMAMKV